VKRRRAGSSIIRSSILTDACFLLHKFSLPVSPSRDAHCNGSVSICKFHTFFATVFYASSLTDEELFTLLAMSQPRKTSILKGRNDDRIVGSAKVVNQVFFRRFHLTVIEGVSDCPFLTADF